MTMDPKYICFERAHGCADMVIFPATGQHSDMAKALRLEKSEIVSAGFVSLEHHKCYGESTSLGRRAEPEDTQIYRRLFNLEEYFEYLEK